MNKAILLLSGGLDSLVSLGLSKATGQYDVKLAITFDYGQKTAEAEIATSEKICKYYNIEHKVIKLDWLKDITQSSLVVDENRNNSDEITSLWVPNRNSLFLNIAACFCDSLGIKYIIFGANKDEADLFTDNTEDFRYKISDTFKFSTIVQAEVVAPLINYTKDDIVKIAVKHSIPLELVKSCYYSNTKHCGECKSCIFLKQALIANNCEYYIDILFDKNEN